MVQAVQLTFWKRSGEESRGCLLTKGQMKKIQVVESLGEGSFGKVDLISFQGKELVMKTLEGHEEVEVVVREARIHKMLQGAGGAPLSYSTSWV